MRDYTNRSTEEEVNRYLIEKIGFSVSQFENSLDSIYTYCELISRKRGISELRNNIERLESSKEELFTKFKEILSDSNSWGWIDKNFLNVVESSDEEIVFENPDEPNVFESSNEQKADFIRTKFQLNHYFEFIDLRIKQLHRIILISENVHFHTEDKRKRIQVETAIVLVWTLAFNNKGITKEESYYETKSLLHWFSRNRETLLRKLFDQLILKSRDAIRRDYERYILTPSEALQGYKEMAESLYLECFCNRD